MKVKQFEWLADFLWMFSLLVAMNAVRKLHALGQPLSALIAEGAFAAAMFALFNWIRKHGDD